MEKYILYWVSRAIRVSDNPALALAQHLALTHKLPLKVVFVVYPYFPHANVRNMHFLLGGLAEMQKQLHLYNIALECVLSQPLAYFESIHHSLHTVVVDHHVLKPVIATQNEVHLLCQRNAIIFHCVSVATVVPVEIASNKLEFAAKTFRPKIMRQFQDWLTEADALKYHPYNSMVHVSPIDCEAIIQAHPHWRKLSLSTLIPGEKAGYELLERFIHDGLDRYDARNEVGAHAQSFLSAYLHFGMISPKIMIKRVMACASPNAALFIEEAMVRRELAENYCHYNKKYDSLEGAWPWAIATLLAHKEDRREYVYDFETFDNAATHDYVWNYCMQTIKATGYCHSYLRMYWAKMVLYWTADPSEAIAILIQLNDTYFLDGRDPNGYTGIMWSVAGVHDRPWFDRPVTGLIRAMGKEGTLRKTKLKL